MLKLRNTAFPIILLLLFGSCVGTQSLISFEILEPAVITYPENVQKVGYLNRSPRTHDSFVNEELFTLNNTDLYILDTIICNSIKRGFEDGKNEYALSFLDSISYLVLRRNDTIGMNSNISVNDVINICDQFGLNAIISMDYYNLHFGEYIYLEFDKGQYEKAYVLYLNMKWTVNIPGRVMPLKEFNYIDTLYFVTQDTLPVTKYISPLEVMRNGTYEVGYAFGKWNVPGWNEISRVVYIGREYELRSATKYTDEGDWDSALKIWNEHLKSEDKRLAAKSAHNLAVYYEIEDDLIQALDYSKRANELWPSPRIEFYKQELEIRLLNKKDIMMQLRIE